VGESTLSAALALAVGMTHCPELACLVRSLVSGSPRATHWQGLEVMALEEALASEQAGERASE
jgi:hypothetical protein